MRAVQASARQLPEDLALLRLRQLHVGVHICFQLCITPRIIQLCTTSEGVLLRTGEARISSIGGATKYRTFSSRRRYLALPFTTCAPGAPVRSPPGSVAWRVPVPNNPRELEFARTEREPEVDLCSSPCYRALESEAFGTLLRDEREWRTSCPPTSCLGVRRVWMAEEGPNVKRDEDWSVTFCHDASLSPSPSYARGVSRSSVWSGLVCFLSTRTPLAAAHRLL